MKKSKVADFRKTIESGSLECKSLANRHCPGADLARSLRACTGDR